MGWSYRYQPCSFFIVSVVRGQVSSELQRPCGSHIRGLLLRKQGSHKEVVILYSIPGSSNRELAGMDMSVTVTSSASLEEPR